MAKSTEKFDPAEVPLLLEKAKSGDIVSRDELLYRFQRLVATLVNVCITGRPNFWSSYQKTFLKMFAGKNVPLQNIAVMLKKELAGYEKEELFSTGQLAVLLAIEKCETNLATTIVICFKDLIHKMIKDPSNKLHIELDECILTPYDNSSIEEIIFIDLFIDRLNAEEKEIVEKILDGERVKVPESLKIKLKKYMR